MLLCFHKKIAFKAFKRSVNFGIQFASYSKCIHAGCNPGVTVCPYHLSSLPSHMGKAVHSLAQQKFSGCNIKAYLNAEWLY